jgi:hypothetical protein
MSLESNSAKRTCLQQQSDGLRSIEGIGTFPHLQQSYAVNSGDAGNNDMATHSQNSSDSPPSYEQALEDSMREQFANFGRQAEDHY